MILRRGFLKSAVCGLLFPTVIKFESVANVLRNREIWNPGPMPPFLATVGPGGDYPSLATWKAAWERYCRCDLALLPEAPHAILLRNHADNDFLNPDVHVNAWKNWSWSRAPIIEMDPMNLYGLNPDLGNRRISVSQFLREMEHA